MSGIEGLRLALAVLNVVVLVWLVIRLVRDERRRVEAAELRRLAADDEQRV